MSSANILSVNNAFRTYSAFGTLTANTQTAVVVVCPQVTANSVIVLSYKSGTQGGSTGCFVSSLTPGTGFSIKSVAADTSIYNYLVIG